MPSGGIHGGERAQNGWHGRWDIGQRDGREDDEVAIWRPVIRQLGLSRAAVEKLACRAARNGTSLEAELLCSGLVSEAAFYAAVARSLDLDFLDAVEPDRLMHEARSLAVLLKQAEGIRAARVEWMDATVRTVVAPDCREYRRLARWLAASPRLRGRIAVAAPGALRQAVLRRCEAELADRAVNGLADAAPAFSARTTFMPAQAFWCGAALVALAAVTLLWPRQVLLGLHLALIGVFLPCVLLRFMAARMRKPRHPAFDGLSPRDMPRYTVLVALYREAEMVPALLVALGRLEWPRSKLEVKLVCEADDRETLAALAGHSLRPWVEVVRVPPAGPRTKPKALAYALQLSAGELVALYDAEDRPHPHQLLEAWSRLRSADPALACVQAPLLVTNRAANLVARMFAFEYGGLFRAMLPFLSRHGLVIPLGGTSNHFRRSALDEVGGWDPYNVTEDADIGLRLKRFGYRAETITLPTLEAGPVSLSAWLPQRTRWFKGWAQTWLVHMRSPRRLARELGPLSFVVAQILFAGMLLAALAHPLLFVTLLLMLVRALLFGELGIYNGLLLGVDVGLVGLGYLAFITVGARTLPRADIGRLPAIVAATPVYWLMLSLAAWRALAQLVRAPHLCGLMYQRHHKTWRTLWLFPLDIGNAAPPLQC